MKRVMLSLARRFAALLGGRARRCSAILDRRGCVDGHRHDDEPDDLRAAAQRLKPCRRRRRRSG
jgi:hypothetical protein